MGMGRDLSLCKKRLQERKQELCQTDTSSLKYDILLMEIELLEKIITALQGLLDKKGKPMLSTKTRKAVYSVKPTIN